MDRKVPGEGEMNQSNSDIQFLNQLGVHACVFERATLRILSCTDRLAQAAGLDSAAGLQGSVVLDLVAPDSYETFETYLRQFEEFDSVICTLGQAGRGAVRAVVMLSHHLTVVYFPTIIT